MQVIHFTEAATDPLTAFGASSARLVTLADGQGQAHVSCVFLAADGRVEDPPRSHDCALLVVHGEVSFAGPRDTLRLELRSGVGLVLKAGTDYRLQSQAGATVLLLECERLHATAQGLSTPARIAGARWAGEWIAPAMSGSSGSGPSLRA